MLKNRMNTNTELQSQFKRESPLKEVSESNFINKRNKFKQQVILEESCWSNLYLYNWYLQFHLILTKFCHVTFQQVCSYNSLDLNVPDEGKCRIALCLQGIYIYFLFLQIS